MKSGTFSVLVRLYLIVSVALMIPSFGLGVPMIKNFQLASCLSGSYGYVTPLAHVEVQMTQDSCADAVNKLVLFRLVFVTVLNGIISVFGTVIAFFGLSLIDSSTSREPVDSNSPKINQYGNDHLVEHLISASGGDMSKVEEKLGGIPKNHPQRNRFIEQYVESLPVEDRDAAVKRLTL